VIRVVIHTAALTVPGTRVHALEDRVHHVLTALGADDPIGSLGALGALPDREAAVGPALGPQIVVSSGNLVQVHACGPCPHEVRASDVPRSDAVLFVRASCGCLAVGTVLFQPQLVATCTTFELRQGVFPELTMPDEVRIDDRWDGHRQ
jgi:hypothetical protein